MRFMILVCALSACMVGDPDDLDNGDDGEDDGEEDVLRVEAADPTKLNIGFNNGSADQFTYYPTFFNQSVSTPARLCHAYVSWKVANQAPGSGSIADHSSRAFIEDWLSKAQGQCAEALISFKSMTPGDPPSTSQFADAFEKFIAIDWRARTGFTGSFAFTAWNEPNNGDDTGNGLRKMIEPRLAARYYLVAARACRKRNNSCKVAAGDFASNGNMWDHFRWNCANDNVTPGKLCDQKSSLNPDGRGPSYLDTYKNEIANKATELGLPPGFRPEYFAYHGWHDTNRYIDAGDHCSSYETCTLRRLLRSLRGSWEDVVIWNTEDGVGQTSSPDDHAQACAAAFVVRLHTISSRIKRLYVTRLKGGPGTLLDGTTPRPALGVLAKRQRQAAGTCR